MILGFSTGGMRGTNDPAVCVTGLNEGPGVTPGMPGSPLKPGEPLHEKTYPFPCLSRAAPTWVESL